MVPIRYSSTDDTEQFLEALEADAWFINVKRCSFNGDCTAVLPAPQSSSFFYP